MMTKVSRWLLYISSYSFGYILIAISNITGIVDRLSQEDMYKSTTLLKRIELIFLEGKILFITLLILFFISVVWLLSFKKWKNNTRIHERMEKDCTIEAVGFLFPYIVSMLLVKVGFYGNLVNLLLFFLLGIVFVSSGFVQTSLSFVLMRYHILKNDNCYVITKLTREGYNLKLEDTKDGIEVRELAKGVYMMFP